MAAVETSPPRTSASLTSTPSYRKPLPNPNLSPERRSRLDATKQLPIIPIPEASRVGQAPVSPVRVNFQPDNWAQPSSANIEMSPETERHLLPSVLDRDLPKTPDAPTPPPHTPLLPQAEQAGLAPHAALEQTEMSLPPIQSPGISLDSNLLSPVSPGFLLESSSTQPSQPQGAVVNAEADSASTSDALKSKDENRHSRDTDTTATTASTSQQQNSAEPSVITSASSVSLMNEGADGKGSGDGSTSSIIEEGIPHAQSVPQLQYHHEVFLPRAPSLLGEQDPRIASTPDILENGAQINRHLTPTSSFVRRSSLPRPASSYSVYSDFGPRGRSPGLYGNSHARAPSAHSRRSPDTRPSSYAELLNVPYPQPAPAPISFDNSQLRNAVGSNASLLSAQKTLEMYRQNVKKTNDPSIQYSFAVFLIATAQEQGLSFDDTTKRKNGPKPMRDHDSPYVEATTASPHELVREARAILQKLANAGYPFAQYYLADGYASGLFNKGKEDYNSAFPLFVLAAKHGHAESAYRTALCYEFGWGCRKDPAKAVQFLRTAASKRHPGAMTRLGTACLSGDLGEKRYREGIKWLKLATESADTMYNAAPYNLGCLFETGYGDDIFKDEAYAAELFTQAAELGHAEASYRMGDAYEHGKLNCPRDPALSVHFYTGAAERGHAAAMMGLCAWYMVGAEPILEKDEEEAYEWARRSAELGYVKAQYAVGYFTEMGIGCRRDILEANVWYVKAADAGDERAKQRLAVIRAAVSGGTPMEVGPPRNGKIKKNGDKDDNCVVM
ncbi:Tetratricopeptide-like helical [Pleurostoma richardsiae]|uniref:Tetratricopeptide-like helical n=1 Tax=Pleurostoma richardsiae TaxID=41990 RepID=A0AA38VQF9_9PEZI|nr:Tetratricopeptide-like helical [Pleurostoma richardsiae]